MAAQTFASLAGIAPRGRHPFGGLLALALCAVLSAGCDSGSNPLAPYEGARPLTFLRVTQNFQPDVQWVGGRVAAVGVNRGPRAALDSTLVWLQTASGNEIASHVTFGQAGDDAAVAQYGGVPLDSLEDGAEYTFWLAEEAAFEAALEEGALTPHTFVDTTVTMNLFLRGTSRGGAGIDVRIVRSETLLETRYFVHWTPAIPFRQVGLRKGAGIPGFRDLVWHTVQSEGDDAILPPLTIGVAPEGASDAVAFPESGFESDSYVLWMTDSTWQGDFSLRAPGLAYFVIFASNFE